MSAIVVTGAIRNSIEYISKTVYFYNNVGDIYFITWKSTEENNYNEKELVDTFSKEYSLIVYFDYDLEFNSLFTDKLLESCIPRKDKNTMYIFLLNQPTEEFIERIGINYTQNIDYIECPYRSFRLNAFCSFYSCMFISRFIMEKNKVYDTIVKTRNDTRISHIGDSIDMNKFNVPITFWTDRGINDHFSVSSFDIFISVWSITVDELNSLLGDSHDPECTFEKMVMDKSSINYIRVKSYHFKTIYYVDDGKTVYENIPSRLYAWLRYNKKYLECS